MHKRAALCVAPWSGLGGAWEWCDKKRMICGRRGGYFKVPSLQGGERAPAPPSSLGLFPVSQYLFMSVCLFCFCCCRVSHRLRKPKVACLHLEEVKVRLENANARSHFARDGDEDTERKREHGESDAEAGDFLGLEPVCGFALGLRAYG